MGQPLCHPQEAWEKHPSISQSKVTYHADRAMLGRKHPFCESFTTRTRLSSPHFEKDLWNYPHQIVGVITDGKECKKWVQWLVEASEWD
eukprot:11089598-Ditylum_brightwellii.AAC.1